MPRKSRIDAPGALHHIIVRGIERKTIFKDDADKDNFLERLKNILTDSNTSCFVWASRELGMSMVQLSKRLKISQPTASQSATRGEKIAKENKLKLLKNK
ncbi:MAG: hypothetical protein BBJ57_10730 [Desulfobacterales bacterium PC51MH44]|nr:MAG: hypothetical protein BBJ57_10730 [Desulfobacterales bacterium PC51MH44]